MGGDDPKRSQPLFPGQIEPGNILQHNLLDPADTTKVMSVITYRFTDNNTATTLYAREDLAIEMTGQEYEDAVEGWNFALNLVKEIAETVQ